MITAQDLATAMNYDTYIDLANSLFAEGKTTGPKQSEMMTHYTGMNLRRMKRIRKTIRLQESSIRAMRQIQEAQVWVVITEAWCGDAAQILPIIQAMADENPQVEVKIILRDENLPIIDAYLTNGARAIPKLIMLRASDLEELGNWGPRPAQAQELLLAHKAQPGRPYQELAKDLQVWYNRDKALSTQSEIVAALGVAPVQA